MTYDQPRVSLLRWTAAGAAFAAVLTPVLLLVVVLAFEALEAVFGSPASDGVSESTSDIAGVSDVLLLVFAGAWWGAVVAFVTALVVNYQRDPRAGTRAPSPGAADRPGEPAQR